MKNLSEKIELTQNEQSKDLAEILTAFKEHYLAQPSFTSWADYQGIFCTYHETNGTKSDYQNVYLPTSGINDQREQLHIKARLCEVNGEKWLECTYGDLKGTEVLEEPEVIGALQHYKSSITPELDKISAAPQKGSIHEKLNDCKAQNTGKKAAPPNQVQPLAQ